MARFSVFLPGFFVAAMCALAALFLSEHYAAPVMLFALLLGIALSFLYEEDTRCRAGIDFSATVLLRCGIALLGLRLAVGDLLTLGWQTALMLLAATGSTLIVGLLVARLLGLRAQFGLLSGGAVGICGASAAMAIAAVLPQNQQKERDTLVTIIGVTAFSTSAMVLYPIFAGWLGLNELQTGIFLGATIHDVAQVVGAGYSVSEQSGNLATLTKLVRVAYLMPVVVMLMVVIKMRARSLPNGSADSTAATAIPGFLFAFVILMLLNNVFTLPSFIIDAGNKVSRFSLIIAITAIGMKSNLKQLLTVGLKPFILLAVESLWIATCILVCLLLS